MGGGKPGFFPPYKSQSQFRLSLRKANTEKVFCKVIKNEPKKDIFDNQSDTFASNFIDKTNWKDIFFRINTFFDT